MDVFQSRKGRNDRGRSVERENDRDESDISSGRSRKPESGGKRSKSRERGHSQRTRRSRSNSPKSEFHKALDRWKKFKQSHRVSTKMYFSLYHSDKTFYIILNRKCTNIINLSNIRSC